MNNVINILEARKVPDVTALMPAGFPFQEDFGRASSLLASIANENITEHLGLISGELAVLADLKRQRAAGDLTPGLEIAIRRSQENAALLQVSIDEMAAWAREAVDLMHQATGC